MLPGHASATMIHVTLEPAVMNGQKTGESHRCIWATVEYDGYLKVAPRRCDYDARTRERSLTVNSTKNFIPSTSCWLY